jgi:hypothetical protein
MKKIELFCIQFALYVYTTYIVEDWGIYTKWGKRFIYIPWFYRACVIWLFCPIFLPEYFFKQSSIYKHIKKIQDSPEYKESLIRSMKYMKFQ